ncbi:uncharacterized protein C8R40DRAFT_1069774 [Lentinula edodes]|uniref:uncharacterized protein n=1 Tax=Lentinula edodes TaxID=5353 RepID=UPI001E8EDA63|nr:uncharacterized protein C8R40DRAFT_1069774 [Lentinula edodes]KAH7874853.1 hypothetical protein C8R40DRAFT_1069774 [Lentinula edodes]
MQSRLSIKNAADVGLQLPPLLVTTNNDVDTNSRSLSFLLNSLGSQWTSFVLVAILVAPIYHFRGYFHVMDIDEPDTLSAATDPPPSSPPSSPGILSNFSSDIELVDLGSEEFRIRRPPGPQPAHTIALPVYNHDVFEVEYVNILIAGARRSHRGIRDNKLTAASTKETTSILAPTKKPKKLKGSALRRITMMGLNSDGTSNSPVQRSKDMRTLAEQEALLRWADEYYAAHPYVLHEDVLKELKAESDAQVNSPALITEYMHSTHEQITGLSSIVGTVVNMLAQSMPALAPLEPQIASIPPLSAVTPHPPPSLPPFAFTFAPLPTLAHRPTSAALASAPAPAPVPMPALTSMPTPTPVPAAPPTSASVFVPPFTPMPAALPTSAPVFVPPFTSTSTSTSATVSAPPFTSTPAPLPLSASVFTPLFTSTPAPTPAPLPISASSASVFAHAPAPPSTFTSIPLPPSYKPLSNTSLTLTTNNADLSGNDVIMSDSSALPSKLRKAHKSIGDKTFELILANHQ